MASGISVSEKVFNVGFDNPATQLTRIIHGGIKTGGEHRLTC
jgi:hypothetical protein